MASRFIIRRPLLSALSLALLSATAVAEPYSIGFMADTQWTSNDAANNPNTVALGIMNQILPKFVEHKVKFVLQFGDLTDNGSNAGLDVWNTAAQQLYNAGIGFYPVRGNHEPSQAAALRFQTNFPQTRGMGTNLAGGVNHRSPTTPAGLTGLTYAFEYQNATFIAIDQFVRTNNTGTSANSATLDQVDWITQTLQNRPANTHAFLFSHKPLIGQNHVDNIFGANPSSNPTQRNTLIKAMASTGARYYLSGHDHMYNRSLVKSPDGTAQVQNIIHSSDSYKFYIPTIPSNDQAYNASNRQETLISQELFTIGYYVATIDGPNLTVVHYASDNGCGGSLGAGKDCDLKATPVLNFVKRETYGYSLIGKEFVIPAGGSFANVADQSPAAGSGWVGTKMAIIDGTNAVSASMYDGRSPVQDINTGWQSRTEAKAPQLKSDVLTLWGMHNRIGSEQGDTFTLSVKYEDAARGALALMHKNDAGQWVPAIVDNFGGAARFVAGPWKAGYGLGAYGVDHATKTVWAVVNRGGEFAVAPSLDGDLNGDGIVDSKDIALLNSMIANATPASAAADLDADGKLGPLDLRKLTLLCTLPNCASAQ